jgi:hypothetical protein
MMYKYLLCSFLLLAALPAVARHAPQDTAALSLPAAKPVLPLYFLPRYNSMTAKPATLHFDIDPLLAPAHYEDVLNQRNRLSISIMEQQVIGRLREEQRQMQINAGLSTAVGLFFWGALIEENIRGYLNDRHGGQSLPPPAPARPPELRRP